MRPRIVCCCRLRQTWGALVDVGALGVDIDAVSGFDIDGRDDVALLAANVAGSTGTSLHTVNLTTGAASASLGVVGGGESDPLVSAEKIRTD